MAPRGRSSFTSKDASALTNASSSASMVGVSSMFWKYTKIMNMRDLSRDDDYLSHLFVEKLGISATPLMVHKMDPLRRLPKTDAVDILGIVKRLIHAKSSGSVALKQSVTELLSLHAVRYFIKDYEQFQINAFATHATRYLELYLPSGSIEIAQTNRYSKWTGKSELCILATRPMAPGVVITELKGSMADLTEIEDKELKRTGARNYGGTRRDFSVIHSRQMKKNHLFLGPARFVNHDCDHNCELFRTGRYITFRVIKPIAIGQEITAHYGDGYFGRNNRHCLCETCEKNGRGGYCPEPEYADMYSDSSSSSYSNSDDEDDEEEDSDSSSVVEVEVKKQREKERERQAKLNVNQRSTRRGVYLTLPNSEPEQESSSSESEEENEVRVSIGVGGEREPDFDLSSDLTSLSTSSPSAPASSISQSPPLTALTSDFSGASASMSATSFDVEVLLGGERMSSVVSTSKDTAATRTPMSISASPSPFAETTAISATSPSVAVFKSVITTRGQKAREASQGSQITSSSISPLTSRYTSSRPSSVTPIRAPSFRATVKVEPEVISLLTPPPDATEMLPPPPPPNPAPRKRGRPRKYPRPDGSGIGGTVVSPTAKKTYTSKGKDKSTSSSNSKSSPITSTSTSVSITAISQARNKVVTIKQEPPREEKISEPRVLRARRSLPALSSSSIFTSVSASASGSSSSNTGLNINAGSSKGKGRDKARDLSGTPAVLHSERVVSGLHGKEKDTEKANVPSCKTCLQPLSLSPGVGNNGAGCSPGKTSSRKGKTKEEPEECQRCQRHFIVYGVAWPHRITSNGSNGATPTSRELTPAIGAYKLGKYGHHSHSNSSSDKVIKNKVSRPHLAHSTTTTAHLNGKKRPRERDESEDRELPKKRKILHKPDIRQYGKAYAKAKLLGRTSKAQMPSVSVAATRPRGRPSLKPKGSAPELAVESSLTDLEDQPRDYNGRFGRKALTNGRFGRRIKKYGWKRDANADPCSPSKRSRVEESEQNMIRQYKTTSATRSVKRRRSEMEETNTEKTQKDGAEQPGFGIGQGDDFDDRRDKSFWPALPPLPPVGLGFKRTGLLNMRPNPAVVSRWRSHASPSSSRSPESTPNLIDDTDDVDDDKSDGHPATPEDMGSHTLSVLDSDNASFVSGQHKQSDNRRHYPEVIEIDDSDDNENLEDRSQFKHNRVLPALKKFGLSAKPSPMALSKLKWAPKLKVVDNSDDDPSPFPAQSDKQSINSARSSAPHLNATAYSVQSLRRIIDGNSNASDVEWKDGSSSSGEEDIILPGTSGPHLFTLQKMAAFATLKKTCMGSSSGMITAESNEISKAEVSGRLLESDDHVRKSNASKDLRVISPKVLAISGRLHSSFLSSPVSPSKLVDAGWESNSDASPEPQVA